MASSSNQITPGKSFPEIAVEMGLLTPEQVKDIHSAESKLAELGVPESFERIAVKKGLLSVEQAKAIQKKAQGEKKKVFAGFEILERVGQGAMGAVFRARQLSMDRIVALKILPPKLAKNHAFKERFIREARASGRLDHLHIVHGIDVGESQGLAYFAMEFVDGPTCKSLLKRSGKLVWSEAVRIAAEIANALGYAWNAQKLVHRDVKPDNIMLTRDMTAKLCDLGLAKEFEAADAAGLTQSGEAVGTPHYISPEQAKGQSDIDIRADLYGLGATLYHMVCGRVPFDGPNSTAVMVMHVTDVTDGPRTFVPDLPHPLEVVIAKAMAKEPADRYQTPGEMEEDLRGLIDGHYPIHCNGFKGKSSIRYKPLPPPNADERRAAEHRPQHQSGRFSRTTGSHDPVGRSTTRAQRPVGRTTRAHDPVRGGSASKDSARRPTTKRQDPVGMRKTRSHKPVDTGRSASRENHVITTRLNPVKGAPDPEVNKDTVRHAAPIVARSTPAKRPSERAPDTPAPSAPPAREKTEPLEVEARPPHQHDSPKVEAPPQPAAVDPEPAAPKQGPEPEKEAPAPVAEPEPKVERPGHPPAEPKKHTGLIAVMAVVIVVLIAGAAAIFTGGGEPTDGSSDVKLDPVSTAGGTSQPDTPPDNAQQPPDQPDEPDLPAQPDQPTPPANPEPPADPQPEPEPEPQPKSARYVHSIEPQKPIEQNPSTNNKAALEFQGISNALAKDKTDGLKQKLSSLMRGFNKTEWYHKHRDAVEAAFYRLELKDEPWRDLWHAPAEPLDGPDGDRWQFRFDQVTFESNKQSEWRLLPGTNLKWLPGYWTVSPMGGTPPGLMLNIAMKQVTRLDALVRPTDTADYGWALFPDGQGSAPLCTCWYEYGGRIVVWNGEKEQVLKLKAPAAQNGDGARLSVEFKPGQATIYGADGKKETIKLPPSPTGRAIPALVANRADVLMGEIRIEGILEPGYAQLLQREKIHVRELRKKAAQIRKLIPVQITVSTQYPAGVLINDKRASPDTKGKFEPRTYKFKIPIGAVISVRQFPPGAKQAGPLLVDITLQSGGGHTGTGLSQRFFAIQKEVGNYMTDRRTPGTYHPLYPDLAPKDLLGKRPKGVKAQFVDSLTGNTLVRYVFDPAELSH